MYCSLIEPCFLVLLTIDIVTSIVACSSRVSVEQSLFIDCVSSTLLDRLVQVTIDEQ
jgi:hypothetical protein